MTDLDQKIRENQLREKNLTVPLTIQIPAEKYQRLQELARLSGQESLTFIDGTADFSTVPCEKCPAMPLHCSFVSLQEKKYSNKDCKANILTWFFNEEA